MTTFNTPEQIPDELLGKEHGPSTAITAISVSLNHVLHYCLLSGAFVSRLNTVVCLYFLSFFKLKITILQDFPEKSYTPKVQLPFFTPPGQCPRKIEMER